MKAKAPHRHEGTQLVPMLGIAASAQHEYPRVSVDPMPTQVHRTDTNSAIN